MRGPEVGHFEAAAQRSLYLGDVVLGRSCYEQIVHVKRDDHACEDNQFGIENLKAE